MAFPAGAGETPAMNTNIILGGGQAGSWAAVAMRQAGFAGRILLIGEEAFRPYERPPLSKAWLSEPAEPPIQHFHAEARYAELDIDFVGSRAGVAIDPIGQRVRLDDDSVHAYDKLLLATGGRARALPVPGGEHALTLRTIKDARKLRQKLAAAQRVVCVGAGVIGLEIAAAARNRGLDVTVIEAGPAPMGRSLTPEVSDFITRLHREAGATLHFDLTVEAIDAAPDGTISVICGRGFGFAADLVVAGIGMERDLDLARSAGLAIDGGIVADEFGQTSVANIHAAGDVAAFFHPLFGQRLRLESWRHAQNHGVAVGQAMAGKPTPYADIPWFWTDQHGVNLQIAGLPHLGTRTIVRPGVDWRHFVAVHLLDDGTVIGVTAANMPRDIRAGTAMIRSGLPIDAGALADAGTTLSSLIPHKAR